MRFSFRVYHLVVVVVTAAVATAALATTLALAGNATVDKPPPYNPFAGKTDAEVEATITATHARDDQFVRDFVAQHRDPRSLPVSWVTSYAPYPPSVDAAARAATLIVHGIVQTITFDPNPSGGLPYATSQIQVVGVVKGQASPVISVFQLGGPVAPGDGGRLAQLAMDPLVLPGDEVVLLLAKGSAGQLWRPVYGAGVYVVRNGIIEGEAAEHYGSGKPMQDLLSAR